MTTPYTPNPAVSHATIDVPVDGDGANAATWVGMQQLADNAANAQANQAKVNANNAFTGNNTHTGSETFTGVVTVGGLGYIKDNCGLTLGALRCTTVTTNNRKCLGLWGNATIFVRMFVADVAGVPVIEHTTNCWFEAGVGWHYDDSTQPATYEVLNGAQKLFAVYASGGATTWTTAAFVANGLNLLFTGVPAGYVVGNDGTSGQMGFSNKCREGWNQFGSTAGFGYHAGGGMGSHTSGLQPLTCFRDAFGQVHLQGWVSYDGSNGADKGWISTLPAGYRPTKRINIPVFVGPDRTFGSIPVPPTFGVFYLDESGVMRIADSAMAAVASSYSLDGITWSVI